MANLSVGEKFPAFVLPDEGGEPFDLRSELAEGPLILVFYRGDGDPTATGRCYFPTTKRPELRFRALLTGGGGERVELARV